MLSELTMKNVIEDLAFNLDKPTLLIAIENGIATTLSNEDVLKTYENIIREMVTIRR